MRSSFLWREARRQWRLPIEGPLFLLGLALWASERVLVESGDLKDIWGVFPGMILSFGWPVLAALAGAAALSGDRHSRTDRPRVQSAVWPSSG
jgi:hypothetical protein